MKYDLQVLEKQLLIFGEKIKEERAKLGLSLDKIAAETGLTKSYLSRIERGQRDNPSFLVVVILCDYFNISIESVVRIECGQ